MKKTKAQLEFEIRKLSLELNKIKDKEYDATNAEYFGLCYKTRNNYSCPQKPSDYWWLYVKVTSVKDGIKGIVFQIDCHGRIEIRPNDYLMAGTLDSYTQISDAHWDAARLKLLDKIRDEFKDAL